MTEIVTTPTPASSGPSASTGSTPATPAPASTPAQSAPPSTTGSTAPTPANTSPRSPKAGNAPSSTTPKSVASTPQAEPATPAEALGKSTETAPAEQQTTPAEDPVKTLRDQLSTRGREMAQMRAQQERMRAEMEELRKFRESQVKQAEQAKLRRWDARHPENSKFEDVKRKIAYAREMARKVQPPPVPEGMDPAQGKLWQDAYVQARKQELAATVDPADWEEHAAWEQDQQAFQQKLYADPRGTMREIMQAEIREAFQQQQELMRAEQEVNADLNDEFLGPAMREHQAEFADVVSRLGETDAAYETARHMVKLAAANKYLVQQLAELKQQQGTLEDKASAAEAQQQLVKRKASVTADPKPGPGKSIFQQAKEWAEKNGQSTASDAFMAKVSELTAKQYGLKIK